MSPLPVILMRCLGLISLVRIVSSQGLTNTTSQALTNIAGANNATPAATCKRIDSQLPGRISYPADLVYSNSLSTYYSAQERALVPGCIFTPTSTADVSEFVKLMVAQSYGSIPQFAIRCGGHKYFAGAANVAGGITVDMRGLHDVSFNEDLSVISIGGGAVWNTDVYKYLVPQNLTVAGARLPGLGVGGFVTGGGITFVARRDGWAADTVVSYEVVLASGEVVHASATSHRDLWLALKGGSNNFGIVTHFNMSTYSQGKMLGGVIGFNYTPSALDAQAKAFSNFMKPENFDEKAMMGVLLTYENGISGVANSLFYLDPEASPTVFKPFLSIPGQISNKLLVSSVSDIVNTFGAFTPLSLFRAAETTYSFENGHSAVYSNLFKSYNESLQELEAQKIPGSGIQWLIQPQPVTNSTNSFGLKPDVKDGIVISLVVGWNNVADDPFMLGFLKSMHDKHVAILTKAGLFNPFIYLNYADKSQDPIDSYGQNVKQRLIATSKTYDPKQIFQVKVPGGFKL